MSEKSNLLLRYEKMLRGECREWFDTEDYEEIALEYEMASMLSDALDVIETGLQCHPMSEELMTKKAYYLMVMGRTDESQEVISVVTDKTEESQSIRAELKLIAGEEDKAIEILRDSLLNLSLQPGQILNIIDLCVDYTLYDDISSYIFIAIDKLSRTDKLNVLREFLKLTEEEEEYKWQLILIEKILDLDPYSYNEWIKIIELHIYFSDIDKALDAVDYALAIDPTKTEANYYKAFCSIEQGNYDDAVTILASLDKTKDEGIFIMLATCFTKMGKFEDSNSVLTEMEGYFPDNASAMYLRAENIYKATKDYDEAIVLLQKAEKILPYSFDIIYKLAKLFYEKEEYANSKEVLSQLLYVDYEQLDDAAVRELSSVREKNLDKIYILSGDIEVKSGDSTKALYFYKKAFDLNNYDVDTCFRLIYAYSELDDVENMQNMINYVEGIMNGANVETLSAEDQVRLSDFRLVVEKIKDILRNHIDDNI